MNLKSILQEQFPNIGIVTLEDITKKIAGISKVRVGKDRTFTDYDEISLNDIDAYGVVFIPESPKEVGSAYYNAMNAQILQPGDVVMTHRGKVGKVGLIGNNYKRVIVGNNSMIRIQFPDNRKYNTPLFVQVYLQLPYVKEYLDNQITCGSQDRKILSAASLSKLPIPLFNEGQIPNLKELLYSRVDLLKDVNSIMFDAQELVTMCEKMKTEFIFKEMNKSAELPLYDMQDDEILNELVKTRDSLNETIDKYNTSK